MSVSYRFSNQHIVNEEVDPTIYPIVNIQVLQSAMARRKASRDAILRTFLSRDTTSSLCSRATATNLWRAVNLFDVSGKSSRIKLETIAKNIVTAPSTTNNQRQPRRPRAPSRPSTIAAARRPPNAPERIAAEI